MNQSRLARDSLILGLLGLATCGLSALIGLALGVIALVMIKRNRGDSEGLGLALSGTITSALVIGFFTASLIALAGSENKAREINCVNNEKEMWMAMESYAGKHGNHLPPAVAWCDVVKTQEMESPRIFKCPANDSTNTCDYAFNAKLDGLDITRVNSNTVVVFESDAGWNAHGGPELLPARPRHEHLVVVLAGGNCRRIALNDLGSLRWEPR